MTNYRGTIHEGGERVDVSNGEHSIGIGVRGRKIDIETSGDVASMHYQGDIAVERIGDCIVMVELAKSRSGPGYQLMINAETACNILDRPRETRERLRSQREGKVSA